jgi:DNA repair exonuclease SbcCD nuclease subunit
LCGDIHKRQQFILPNGGKAVMVGSLIQQNFGETIRNHGYGVYDVENDDYQFVDLPNPKPFLKFYINSIDALVEGNEKLVNY